MDEHAPPARMLDRYAIGAKLGAGGFGTVYRARHTILGTDVALKVLSAQHAGTPDVVQRFLREAKAAASVGSPHIVTVHDAGIAEGVPFLAMELLTGEDLEGRIARGGALPASEAIDIVIQVLEGLDAAHARGIVHRDMKPANVFLTTRASRPFVKLLDFGISKIVEPEQRRLTQTGALFGTPAYMAPEQILDVRNVDARADLYAVSVMLFEALTGRLPHPADTFADLMARMSGAEAEPLERYLPSAPPALCAFVARGMRADPAERFASAAEMARALADLRAAPMTQGAFAPLSSTTGPLGGGSPFAVGPVTPSLGGAPAPTYPPAPAAVAHAPQTYPPKPVSIGPQTYPPTAPPFASAPPSYASPASSAGVHVPTGAVERRRSSGVWLAVGALALLLPLACIGGVVLTLRMSPEPVAPVATRSVDPPPVDPRLDPPRLDPVPASRPAEPTPWPESPPMRGPAEGPLMAVAIPSGADPCAIPVEYEVDCDRGWDQRVTTPCPSTGGRELHVFGSYGTGDPVRVEIARTAGPIVLALSAYTATEWQIRLAEGARVERVVTSGHSRSSVTGLPPDVPVEIYDRSSVWPTIAFSWDGMNGHWPGRDLARIAERELGLPMRGYAGCYAPSRFRIGQRSP